MSISARAILSTLLTAALAASCRQHGAAEDQLPTREPPVLTAATPDAEEAGAISAALLAQGFDKVNVEVHGGKVRLLGRVARARHDEALRTVSEAAPRSPVEDRLTLE